MTPSLIRADAPPLPLGDETAIGAIDGRLAIVPPHAAAALICRTPEGLLLRQLGRPRVEVNDAVYPQARLLHDDRVQLDGAVATVSLSADAAPAT